jgi:hypothetical protein
VKSSFCLRGLHGQCDIGICECECHELKTASSGGDDESGSPLTAVHEIAGLQITEFGKVIPYTPTPGKPDTSGVWEDPPTSKPVIDQGEIDLMNSNPGRWRRVRKSAKAHGAASLRDRLRKSGQVVWSEYDVKAYRLEDGGSALYMRRKA